MIAIANKSLMDTYTHEFRKLNMVHKVYLTLWDLVNAMQAAQVPFNTVPTTNWVFTSICNVGSKKPNAGIKEATTKSCANE
jgi:hypothetical protein